MLAMHTQQEWIFAYTEMQAISGAGCACLCRSPHAEYPNCWHDIRIREAG